MEFNKFGCSVITASDDDIKARVGLAKAEF
jgi:hypothetical protein